MGSLQGVGQAESCGSGESMGKFAAAAAGECLHCAPLARNGHWARACRGSRSSNLAFSAQLSVAALAAPAMALEARYQVVKVCCTAITRYLFMYLCIQHTYSCICH